MYNTFVNSNKCRQQITVLLTVNCALHVLTLKNSKNLSATRNSSLWSTLSCVLYMAQMYWVVFVLFYVKHANMIPALWRFELEIVLRTGILLIVRRIKHDFPFYKVLMKNKVSYHIKYIKKDPSLLKYHEIWKNASILQHFIEIGKVCIREKNFSNKALNNFIQSITCRCHKTPVKKCKNLDLIVTVWSAGRQFRCNTGLSITTKSSMYRRWKSFLIGSSRLTD